MRKAISWVQRMLLGRKSGPGACLLRNDPKLRNFEIGEWSYGRPKVLFASSGARLTVGKFVSIADEVTIFLGGEHRVDWITTYPFNALGEKWAHIVGHPATKGDVRVGNDVWIGRAAVILSGVSVGDGAVVGAGAVVIKDVAPYTIVAGNPARMIRPRFDETTVALLRKIQWWNWPADMISDAASILQSNDFDALYTFYLNRAVQSK